MAKMEGKLAGTKVGRGKIAVSHLFFADDSMLFEEASIERANNMKAIIKEYEKQKCGNGSKGTGGGILGVRISNNPERYLGLPTMIGRRKKHAFVDIKERFEKALQNWSLRLL
ncbi:reverse transcriptase [Gossypium australe]|uniref:Reverse transcriptase n=1 Tax=Gossypium australe TaxID=47621 RepID=A0A5B6VUI7_9ROSI|nr:reverse transcriptase [Gossypium australe]